MSLQYVNGFSKALGAPVAAIDTTIVLEAGAGALLPDAASLTANPMRFVLREGSVAEVVEATSRAVDTITVTRAVETVDGLSTAQVFTVAAIIENSPTKETMDQFVVAANNLSDLADAATSRTNLGVDAAGTDNSTNVTLDASVTDVLTLTGQAISADDPGADRILFWDESANALKHLTAGTGLTITDTTITAAGGATDKIEEGNSSVEVVDAGTGQVNITADGNLEMRITDAGLEYYGGNFLMRGSVAGVNGMIRFLPAAASATIHTDYAGSEAPMILGSYSGRTNQVYLATTQRVGIGNTSPAVKLDVTGGINASDDIKVTTAGKTFFIKEGANAKMGQSVLVAGTVTVSTTAVTANSRIFLTRGIAGGTLGHLSVGTITAATSFVINSSDAGDTSTINWLIVEPA